jgi:hypothetical protein
MKTRITIDVSAHLQNGKFIGDEHLKIIRWQLENIGGKYIDSQFIRPEYLSTQPYYRATFEFDCKEDPSFFVPLNMKVI